MSKSTTVSLGNHFDQFINDQITAGRYENINEVIKAGLELLQHEEKKLLELRQAINEGINSGIAYEFDPKKHLADLKSGKIQID